MTQIDSRQIGISPRFTPEEMDFYTGDADYYSKLGITREELDKPDGPSILKQRFQERAVKGNRSTYSSEDWPKANESFRCLIESYQTLRDSNTRSHYDSVQQTIDSPAQPESVEHAQPNTYFGWVLHSYLEDLRRSSRTDLWDQTLQLIVAAVEDNPSRITAERIYSGRQMDTAEYNQIVTNLDQFITSGTRSTLDSIIVRDEGIGEPQNISQRVLTGTIDAIDERLSRLIEEAPVVEQDRRYLHSTYQSVKEGLVTKLRVSRLESELEFYRPFLEGKIKTGLGRATHKFIKDVLDGTRSTNEYTAFHNALRMIDASIRDDSSVLSEEGYLSDERVQQVIDCVDQFNGGNLARLFGGEGNLATSRYMFVGQHLLYLLNANNAPAVRELEPLFVGNSDEGTCGLGSNMQGEFSGQIRFNIFRQDYDYWFAWVGIDGETVYMKKSNHDEHNPYDQQGMMGFALLETSTTQPSPFKQGLTGKSVSSCDAFNLIIDRAQDEVYPTFSLRSIDQPMEVVWNKPPQD
jgi:hypothetical protein